MRTTLPTNKVSAALRSKCIDVEAGRLLLTNFRGSDQERDFTKPPNCNGFGRIRHFRRHGENGWPANPLPIDPAANKLGHPPGDLLRTQAFQNAACNWRCWYCFVPYNLLSADPSRSAWLTVGEILDLYQHEPEQVPVIDLTGGQPDLTPEWVPWMMRELSKRGLEERTYLWSDDNLSTDYFWRHLSAEDMRLVARYRNYGKVCCFKGFSPASFNFNTRAGASLFTQQLSLFQRYAELNIDLYAYVTLTTDQEDEIAREMTNFCDRLQAIRPNLPLRVVPLEIRAFTPTKLRMNAEHERALRLQHIAVERWRTELQRRFAPELLNSPIYEVLL
jgi:uncharacterized Fe-S cluster-containing radical SAM superfamily protein